MAEEIERLVAAYPLATLVSWHPAPLATALPLLFERDERGRSALLGHFSRANPQLDALAADPTALVVFMGPHAYVSPSWLTDRTQAPTWNFAMVQMAVRVVLDDSMEAARASVERLTRHMEADRPDAWSTEELGARYERMLSAIVAFRAEIVATRTKFKLGQNERPDVFYDMVFGLSGTPALAEMMIATKNGRFV